MENSLGCQVCLVKFKMIHQLRRHMRSQAHKLEMQKVFQKDKLVGTGFFPCIVWMDPHSKRDVIHPIVGLSLLTLCFSQDTVTYFYLCHICEEKCPTDRILAHLFSGDHYSSYFSYTNPDVLSFSWVPSMDVRASLRPELTKEVNQRGPGSLQLLDLPQNLMNKFETSTYAEVMCALGENDNLLTLFEAVKPKRTMIQTYQRDSNRKHPLLGMQHLVECLCAGQTEKRYYLCTLCRLTLATHMIIKHVLSFDHIFCFFKAWHPSTFLSKECYKEYTRPFASMMLDLAKQTEEIYGSANSDMKQVSLDPAHFTSVNFASYAEALKELESTTKESLITVVKPGNKLECRALPGECGTPSYKILCQDCSAIFETKFDYLNHLLQWNHKQMLKRVFGKAEIAEGFDQRGVMPVLGLHSFLNKSLKKKQPVIGAALVVTCLSTEVQVEPIHICFACKDCFRESSVGEHFNSLRHHISTLVYRNPWRLPFGWEKHLDVKVLQSQALEEEKERGLNQMILKVLDVPYWIFCLLTLDFQEVIKTLQPYYTLLVAEVPPRETYKKLKDNEKFPLLGKQFFVLYSACYRRRENTAMESLCLLCGRILTDDESHAHLFSREHVQNFLTHFHPGSLDSSTDTETLLDLAKQAARLECRPNVQIIKLTKPVWMPCTYNKATRILAATKRRGYRELRPPITPLKKLFPRKTLKNEEGDKRDNNQEHSETMEQCEKNTTQKSPNNTEITLQVGAGIANPSCVRSECVDAETPTVSVKESEMEEEVFSKASSEEIKDTTSDACQVMKEEKDEEPTARAPREEMMETCPNAENEEGKSKSCQNVPTQSQSYKETERKRPSCMSEQNPNEEAEKEKDCKRPRLSPREERQPLPSVKQEEKAAADVGESGKQRLKTTEASSNMNHQPAAQLYHYVNSSSRDPVIGLSALIECDCDEREPIYLCQCCSLKIRESCIIPHVTGFYHQKKYLGGLQKLPPLGKNWERELKHLAALFEKENGYGEAEAVDLDEKIYNTISKQNFESAIKTLKVFQADQHCLHQPRLTSAQSGVPAGDSSVAPHVEVFAGTDNSQIDTTGEESEDSEARPPSVTTAVSVRTQDEIEASENADEANTCLTVPGSSQVSSHLHVSTSAKNTGNNSDTSVTSETVAASQHAAPSDSVEPTPNMTSITANSRSTAQSSDTITSTVPVTTPNCTTTTTSNRKLTDTSDKGVMVSSCATASTTDQTAANLSPSKATGSAPAQTSHTGMTSKTTETSVKCDDTETSVTTVHMEGSFGFDADVAPDVAKSNSPAAPRLNTQKYVKSEKKHPPTEPSCTAASTTTLSEVPAVAGEGNVAAGQTAQNLKDEDPEADDLISEPHHSCPIFNKSDEEPVATGTEGSDIATAKKVEKPESCVYLRANCSESAGSFAQTPPEQLEKSDPVSQNTQKVLEGPQKAVRSLSPDLLSTAASVEAERQNPSKPGQRADDVPKHSGYITRPPSALQALPVISIGERSHGRSHLSKYLQVMGLEPVIGLDTVWECRGITLDAFFLCQSCMERLCFSDICQHLVSHEHQLEYMRKRYPQYYQSFWLASDLHNYMKLDILMQVAMMISAQERHKKMDAQGILLGEDLYEYVRTAPFSEALEIVQNIKKARTLRAYYPPGLGAQQPIDQQPVDQDTGEESQSAQPLDTDEKSDSDKRQTTEKEETAMAGDLDWVKQRRASSPLDLNVSSGADSVVSPLPGAGTCLSPLDQPDLRLADSQQQTPLPNLQAKREEAPSESPYSSLVAPKNRPNQTRSLSPEDDTAPASESPALTSLQTVVGPCTNNSYLENAASAKCRCSSQQLISQGMTESASESDSPNLLAPNDKDTGSDEQDASAVNCPKFQHLLALVRELKSARNRDLCVSTANNAETSASCPGSWSEGGAQRRWDQKCVQTRDKMAKKLTKWDSRCEQIKVTVRKRTTSTDSWDGMCSAAPPADSEDQLVIPNASSASFAHDSSLEGYSKRGNPLFRETEAQTVCTMLPSASTADFTDPQHQGSGNVSHVEQSPFYCAATILDPGQTPHPQAMTHHFGPGLLPFNSIISARPGIPDQQFIGDYNRPDHTEVTRGDEVAQLFPVVPSGSCDDALAASGVYDQYSKMYRQPYITNGQPVYLSSEALAGYTTQHSPSVYTGRHASLTTAAMATEDGRGTSEAPYLCTAPFTFPDSSFIPVQSSNYVITQNLSHPVICYPSANYQGLSVGSDFHVTTSKPCR